MLTLSAYLYRCLPAARSIAVCAAFCLAISIHAAASISYPADVPAGEECMLGCLDDRGLANTDIPIDPPDAISRGTQAPDIADEINSFLGSSGVYAVSQTPGGDDEDDTGQDPAGGAIYTASLVAGGLLFSAAIAFSVALVRLRRQTSARHH